MVFQLVLLAVKKIDYLEKLVEKVLESSIEGISWMTSAVNVLFGVEAELEKIRNTVKRIEAVLNDADGTRSNELDTTRRWLHELSAIVFDADDLIDEFNTRIHIQKSNANSSRKRKRPWTLVDYSLWRERWRISGKISEIKERFNSVSDERMKLQFNNFEMTPNAERNHRDAIVPAQSASIEGNPLVLGYGAKKDEILDFLKQGGGGRGARIAAIVGAGGIGKTTLVRKIFNDDEVINLFPLMVWVGISQDFDEVSITKKLIEALDGVRFEGLSLDLMQRQLQRRLSGKKFLIVLDGLSSENPLLWETMSAPMMVGEEGSKIMVTCRNELFIRFVGRLSRTIQLNGLEEQDSWYLFCQNALGTNGWGQYKDLEEIGREIVRKCQGSPLAIRTIGCLLYGKTSEEEWKAIEYDIPDVENEGTNSMLFTIKVSYERLPLHLKKCFAFCAIFPTGYEFHKEELVKLWIAVGLVKQKYKRPPELIGSRYFDYLAWRSFFQTSSGPLDRNKKYRMPGLVSEFAQSIARLESLSIGNNSSPNESKNARYALYDNCRLELLVPMIDQNVSLRALILLNQGGTVTKQVTDYIFQTLRCMRALDLENSQLTDVPDSIGNLLHLRYLNLHGTGIQILPESLSNLYNLQTLELGGCEKLQKLPNSLSNLVNLRHLGLHLDWERHQNSRDNLMAMPPGVGTLTSLRTLSRYVVSTDKDSSLSQLKNLDLHVELCISKLENASGIDATEANLKSKKHLSNLMLRWSTSSSSQTGVDEQVLTNLQPHFNLKYLWLENYNSITFPSWLVSPSFNLETLRLSNCGRCERLPLMGSLPKLRCLCLIGLPAVKWMGSAEGFPLLHTLTISNMPNLVRWFEQSAVGMNCLKRLVISNCSQISSIPHVPKSLEHLEIISCPEMVILPSDSCIQEVLIEGSGRVQIITNVHRIKTLNTLTISQFSELHSIDKNHLQGLNSLKQLKIEKCANLDSLATRDLISLELLEIASCAKLSSFDDGLPATLKDFRLQLCDKVMSWPTGLLSLSFLHSMEIQAVPGLKSLPEGGLPQNLRYLAISGCAVLEQQCRINWHLIQNIETTIIGESSTI